MKNLALCLLAVVTLVTFKGYAIEEVVEQTILDNVVACKDCK